MIFNEYGAVPVNGDLAKCDDEIDNLIVQFIKNHPEATFLELRAIGEYFVSSVTVAISEAILSKSMAMRRAEKKI